VFLYFYGLGATGEEADTANLEFELNAKIVFAKASIVAESKSSYLTLNPF
jgi:hypothetical protein